MRQFNDVLYYFYAVDDTGNGRYGNLHTTMSDIGMEACGWAWQNWSRFIRTSTSTMTPMCPSACKSNISHNHPSSFLTGTHQLTLYSRSVHKYVSKEVNQCCDLHFTFCCLGFLLLHWATPSQGRSARTDMAGPVVADLKMLEKGMVGNLWRLSQERCPTILALLFSLAVLLWFLRTVYYSQINSCGDIVHHSHTCFWASDR